MSRQKNTLTVGIYAVPCTYDNRGYTFHVSQKTGFQPDHWIEIASKTFGFSYNQAELIQIMVDKVKGEAVKERAIITKKEEDTLKKLLALPAPAPHPDDYVEEADEFL